MGVQKNKHHWEWRIINSLLDKVLSHSDFILLRKLENTLKRQKESKEYLLETLIRIGVLTREDLEAALDSPDDCRYFNDSVKMPGRREFLGQLLLRAKLITADQLASALQEQNNINGKLGEILVRSEVLSKQELEAVLRFQDYLDKGALSGHLRLGEILFAEGHITREQIENVLAHQKTSVRKIGEILLESGHLQQHHLDRTLKLQQKLITTSLVLWLSFAAMTGVEEACAESFSRTAGVKINISATVTERTTMKTLNQIPLVVVTNNDIRRGYVDIPAASTIAVRSNNPRGYLLLLEIMKGSTNYFDTVTVNIGGQETQLLPGGGYIPQPYLSGEVTKEISYRFILSKDAQPGTYSWPLILSIAPR
ncbi:MAG: hypothetical protein AB2L12_00575 [Smithellaceae bacterium]